MFRAELIKPDRLLHSYLLHHIYCYYHWYCYCY